jgi:hypothetical protein
MATSADQLIAFTTASAPHSLLLVYIVGWIRTLRLPVPYSSTHQARLFAAVQRKGDAAMHKYIRTESG